MAELSDFIVNEESLFALLSADEIERAMRFHFPSHKQRFIITRGWLRKIIALYTNTVPERIVFAYGFHGKPYLKDNTLDLRFNVSHSENKIIFALTVQDEIGVDIEKVGMFNEAVAKRFFSAQEYSQLNVLSASEQANGFYQLWSKKEAIIKAAGQGVWISLSDFSVSLTQSKECITLMNETDLYTYYVEQLDVPDGYEAAVAMRGSIEKIEFVDLRVSDF